MDGNDRLFPVPSLFNVYHQCIITTFYSRYIMKTKWLISWYSHSPLQSLLWEYLNALYLLRGVFIQYLFGSARRGCQPGGTCSELTSIWKFYLDAKCYRMRHCCCSCGRVSINPLSLKPEIKLRSEYFVYDKNWYSSTVYIFCSFQTWNGYTIRPLWADEKVTQYSFV